MCRQRLRIALVAALTSSPALLPGLEQSKPEDALPPGVKGTVLALAGEVRTIDGLAAGMAGRIDPVAAALKELGAKTTDTEIRIEMSADVLFDFDKADLKPEAESALAKLQTVLRAHPRSQVLVEGHTDAKGSDAYNQRLSERRAAAVVGWLTGKAGLAADRLTARGLGATRPVAPNKSPDGSDDPEGRRRNRRVEIVIPK